MTFEASLVVALFIFAIAFILLKHSFTRREVRATEEELQRDASTRGWRLEIEADSGYLLYRYRGTTDGVEWVAESGRVVGGNSDGRRHVARWHGRWSTGVSEPIVAMGVPKGKERLVKRIGEGDGLFARLAQQAAGFAFDKILDLYFGNEIGDRVGARQLRRVESAAVPGFIIMAGNVGEASRVLSEGLQHALVSASNAANFQSDKDRPYVLVRPEGVSLARLDEFRDIKELEQFIQVGLGLRRAFRFGPPV